MSSLALRHRGRATALAAGALAALAASGGVLGPASAGEDALRLPTARGPSYEVLGPVHPPARHHIARGARSLAVAGAFSGGRRVLAGALRVETSSLHVFSYEGEDVAARRCRLRVMARRLDGDGEWLFFDPWADQGETTPTPAGIGHASNVESVGQEPGGLLRIAERAARWGMSPSRAFRTDFTFDAAAERPFPKPFASCGGKVAVETTSDEGDPRTFVVVENSAGRSRRPAVVPTIRSCTPGLCDEVLDVAADVTIHAFGCCGGEVVWLESHPPPDRTMEEMEYVPNHPIVLSLQGARTGPIATDLFPGLAGTVDLIGNLDAAIGCLGGSPVAMVALDSVTHPDEVWFAVPRLRAPVPARAEPESAPAPGPAPAPAAALCRPKPVPLTPAELAAAQVRRLFADAAEIEADVSATPAARATAWCGAAGAKGEGPELVQAREACKRWKGEAAVYDKAARRLARDYEALARTLGSTKADDKAKLAQVSRFLSAHAAQAGDDRVRRVERVRDGWPMEAGLLAAVLAAPPVAEANYCLAMRLGSCLGHQSRYPVRATIKTTYQGNTETEQAAYELRADGRLLVERKVKGRDVSTRTFSYDGEGRLSGLAFKAESKGETSFEFAWRFELDAAGRVTRRIETDPAKPGVEGVTVCAYGERRMDCATTSTDASRSGSETSEWDADGFPVRTESVLVMGDGEGEPTTNRSACAYERSGKPARVESRCSADGDVYTATWVLDEQGRLAEERSRLGDWSSATVYEYE